MIEKLKKINFPTLLVLAAMFFTPLVDRAINNGEFTLLTYVVEGACATFGAFVVIMSFVNAAKDKK